MKPSNICYEQAKHHKSVKYHRLVNNIDTLKSCLEQGYPFIFGFAVYDSFESTKMSNTGMMEMPKQEDKSLGGHAVLAVGYNDEKEYFIIRNSWGSNWGDNGYFYMPYKYILNKKLASDFWTIQKISNDSF